MKERKTKSKRKKEMETITLRTMIVHFHETKIIPEEEEELTS